MMKITLVLLLCLTAASSGKRRERYNRRDRYDQKRDRYDQRPWNHRPQDRWHYDYNMEGNNYYDEYEYSNGYVHHSPYYMPFQGFGPLGYPSQYNTPVDDKPAVVNTPPSRPSPPKAPINPVLSTLNQLPLSMFDSYICNMFAQGGNMNGELVRYKRDPYGLFRHLQHMAASAYHIVKPFVSGTPQDIFQNLQEIAWHVASTQGMDVENVVQEFISNQLSTDGISGNVSQIVSAIQNLASNRPEEIQESTQEAVDQSCSAVDTPFYCNYMKKLSISSGCSSHYFSSEIWTKCCEGKVDMNPGLTDPPLPALSLTTSAPAIGQPTPPSAATTTAPTTTQPKPPSAPTTTQSKPPSAETTTTTTTAATTTAAAATTTTTTTTPVPTTTSAAATTTVAQRECGVSKVNPATKFSDFSSALNQVRIVGGVATEKCEYPWIVRLQVGNSLCGGTILDETHILTAGHCIGTNKASDITVHAGEYDYNVRDADDVAVDVADISVHPNYQEFGDGTVENDIAVLTLKEPLQFTDCVQPICLPESGGSAYLEPGTQCVVAGWGTTSSGGQTSNILQEVTVPTYNGESCNSGIFSLTRPTNSSIQICAGRPVIGEADSCQGDSGGPLFCPVDGRYVQYGVVSYGAGCADAGAAGVYADTSAMLDFINNFTTS